MSKAYWLCHVWLRLDVHIVYRKRVQRFQICEVLFAVGIELALANDHKTSGRQAIWPMRVFEQLTNGVTYTRPWRMVSFDFVERVSSRLLQNNVNAIFVACRKFGSDVLFSVFVAKHFVQGKLHCVVPKGNIDGIAFGSGSCFEFFDVATVNESEQCWLENFDGLCRSADWGGICIVGANHQSR